MGLLLVVPYSYSLELYPSLETFYVKNNILLFISFSFGILFFNGHWYSGVQFSPLYYSLAAVILSLALFFPSTGYVLKLKSQKLFLLSFIFLISTLAIIVGIELVYLTHCHSPNTFSYCLVGILIVFKIFYVLHIYKISTRT